MSEGGAITEPNGDKAIVTPAPSGPIASLAGFARAEPLLASLFFLAAIAVVLPVWIGRYVPLLDYPNHLSLVFVWFHLKDPGWNFAPYYSTHLVPLPYWGQYGAVFLLAFLFGVEIAQKVFLTLALLALPAGVALFARRIGRDPRLAIFAFPLAWNYNVENGFLSYAAGVAWLFFALAALDAWAERPARDNLPWAAIASLLGAVLYFFHILTWGAFLAIGFVLAMLAPRSWTVRNAVLAVLPTAPALAIGLWAYRASSTMGVRVSPWRPGGLSSIDAIWWDVAGTLRWLPEWLIDLAPDGRDEACLIILAIAWLVLMTTRSLSKPTEERGARGWRLEASLAVATLLLFLLPRTLRQPFYWYAVSSRVAVLVALLGALAIRGRLDRHGALAPRRLLLYAAALAGIAYPSWIAVHFHRFNVRARDFDKVMNGLPRGKKVLPLMLNLGDPEVNVNCFNQWGSYVQMREGGFVPYNLDIGFPLRYLAALPAPPWDHPEYFRFSTEGEAWDYFLVHGPSRFDPFAGAHDRVRLAKQAGEWTLYEKLPPPVVPKVTLPIAPIGGNR